MNTLLCVCYECVLWELVDWHRFVVSSGGAKISGILPYLDVTILSQLGVIDYDVCMCV